jgi:hypothetical protein
VQGQKVVLINRYWSSVGGSGHFLLKNHQPSWISQKNFAATVLEHQILVILGTVGEALKKIVFRASVMCCTHSSTNRSDLCESVQLLTVMRPLSPIVPIG